MLIVQRTKIRPSPCTTILRPEVQTDDKKNIYHRYLDNLKKK